MPIVKRFRQSHHVYIVCCADGSLYTGYALDPDARVAAHNAGRGAKYTTGRRPVTLVYAERFRSKGAALRRERAIKLMTRTAKHTLIELADYARRASVKTGKLVKEYL